MYKRLMPFSNGLFKDICNVEAPAKRIIKLCEKGHTSYVLKHEANKNKTHRCAICTLEKRVSEAEKQGISFVAAGHNKDYGVYRLQCGHMLSLKYCHVTSGGFRCKTCLNENQKLSEESLNLVEIGRQKVYSIYRRTDCGHIVRLPRASLSSHCQECFVERWKREAEDAALEIISESKKGIAYKLYKFKSCSHTQDIAISRVREKDFSCKQCQLDKIKKEAEYAGLTLIGKSDKSNKNRVYLANCGHTLDLMVGNVRNNSWVCHECEDTFYTQQSNLYVIEIKSNCGNFNFIKLGYSKNIDKRIKDYNLRNCSAMLIKSASVNTGYEAMTIEQNLHKKYKFANLDQSFTKEYFINSGFTECYPIQLKETLVAEILTKGKTNG